MHAEVARTLTGGWTMLGAKLGGESGKVTAQRVLSNPGGGLKMETSFQAAGTLLGVKHTSTGTYWSVLRPDGTLYGEGQGFGKGAKGEMATWVGQGVGTVNKNGSVSYRGSVYYQTSSAKWKRLNSIAAIFEYEVDAQGNTKSELWEWK
jgi:hypothetical protein